jgi:hypothetical protein
MNSSAASGMRRMIIACYFAIIKPILTIGAMLINVDDNMKLFSNITK